MIYSVSYVVFFLVFAFLCLAANRNWIDFYIFYIILSMTAIGMKTFDYVLLLPLLLDAKTLFSNAGDGSFSKIKFISIIFIAWSLVSLLDNGPDMRGVKRLIKYALLTLTYIYFFPSILEIPLLARSLKAYRNLSAFLACFVAASFLTSLDSFRTMLRNPKLPVGVQALDWSAHDIGHFLSMAILVQLGFLILEKNKRRRKLHTLLIAVSMVVLLISFTKSAWFGLAVGLIVFLTVFERNLKKKGARAQTRNESSLNTAPRGASISFRKTFRFVARTRKRVAATILFLPVFALSTFLLLPGRARAYLLQNIFFHDVNEYVRLLIWRAGLSMIYHNPIMGVGFYGFETHVVKYDTTGLMGVAKWVPTDPHNWWIMVMGDTGIVGFMLFVILYMKLSTAVYHSLTKLGYDDFELKTYGIILFSLLISIAAQGFFEASFMWTHYVWLIYALSIAFVIDTNKLLKKGRSRRALSA